MNRLLVLVLVLLAGTAAAQQQQQQQPSTPYYPAPPPAQGRFVNRTPDNPEGTMGPFARPTTPQDPSGDGPR